MQEGERGVSDEGMKAAIIGAALAGVPGVNRAVYSLLEMDRLRMSVKAVGGSPDDEEAVVKDAERRLAESAAQPWNYDVEDACRDAFAEYLTRYLTVT